MILVFVMIMMVLMIWLIIIMMMIMKHQSWLDWQGPDHHNDLDFYSDHCGHSDVYGVPSIIITMRMVIILGIMMIMILTMTLKSQLFHDPHVNKAG